jgi:hypothetical protein
MTDGDMLICVHRNKLFLCGVWIQRQGGCYFPILVPFYQFLYPNSTDCLIVESDVPLLYEVNVDKKN